MPIQFLDIGFALAAITLLSGLVSIITQVIKLNTNKVSPILISTIAGIIITMGSAVCYCAVHGITITFSILFVAFCASWIIVLTSNIGFDKVKQYFIGLNVDDLKKKEVK